MNDRLGLNPDYELRLIIILLIAEGRRLIAIIAPPSLIRRPVVGNNRRAFDAGLTCRSAPGQKPETLRAVLKTKNPAASNLRLISEDGRLATGLLFDG